MRLRFLRPHSTAQAQNDSASPSNSDAASNDGALFRPVTVGDFINARTKNKRRATSNAVTVVNKSRGNAASPSVDQLQEFNKCRKVRLKACSHWPQKGIRPELSIWFAVLFLLPVQNEC